METEAKGGPGHILCALTAAEWETIKGGRNANATETADEPGS